jgi:hypothetical protein
MLPGTYAYTDTEDGTRTNPSDFLTYHEGRAKELSTSQRSKKWHTSCDIIQAYK